MAKKLSLLYLVFTKLDRASRFSSPCEWELNNIADCDIILPQSRYSRKFDSFGRAELGQDGLEKHEVKEELSKSRKQIEESRLRLTKLRFHKDSNSTKFCVFMGISLMLNVSTLTPRC